MSWEWIAGFWPLVALASHNRDLLGLTSSRPRKRLPSRLPIVEYPDAMKADELAR